jgi:hypothetical protein
MARDCEPRLRSGAKSDRRFGKEFQRKRRMRKMADMGEGGDNDARIESNLDDELAESALKR